MSASPIRGGSTHSGRSAAGNAAAVPPTVDELLEQTARGDEIAFAALYDHASAQVFGLISSIVRDPSQAGQVAHKVWLQAWRAAPAYATDRGAARAWVLSLAHRHAVERLRSTRAAAADTGVPGVRATARRPDERAGADEGGGPDLHCLPGRFGALTGLQRLAVASAYYQGRTYREIGALLSVPLPEVTAAIRDGLLRMRDHRQSADAARSAEMAGAPDGPS